MFRQVFCPVRMIFMVAIYGIYNYMFYPTYYYYFSKFIISEADLISSISLMVFQRMDGPLS